MIHLDEPEQPNPRNWKFVEELSRPAERCFRWTRTVAGENEVDLGGGVEIENNFLSDNLETAFSDLNRFFQAAGIALSGMYKIIFEQSDTVCLEAYRLHVAADGCRIQANDSEGIRRAIYFLEDLLLGADGPFLKTGTIQRKPWVKSRISRCFFGPIKRPPFNRDELLDEVDYYPDEYLNRLAHEGVNGLWLTVAFRDLCRTSITELAPDGEKRLAKLRWTVDKCLRYGIKTYIFCIEPRAMAPDDPALLDNPELKGALTWSGTYCFCPFSGTAQAYLYDSTNWIFSQVPGLGGMINISFGERATTCMSSNFGVDCPVCSKKTPGEIMAAALEPMECGMRDAAPDAELVSWFYVPQNGTGFACDGQMLDVADKLPENVVLQYNFESGGGKEQLGKERFAGDYWLSYVGPSKIFSALGKAAGSRGNALSAKIQVSCSHEVATVPLVPVPGLLYRKYKAMRELGVSHVMQCWYFGCYPGIMNKAAGELAFEEFADTEEDFLHRLAAPQWGAHAREVAEAWALFADAYENYPLENMFQYYGPMHDGVVWPLHLDPANLPLGPTWRLDYWTSGDRYGECLGTFSIEEVLALCAELSGRWNRGVEILDQLNAASRDSGECRKDIGLAEALGIQFRSGSNIMKFYALREELLAEPGSGGLEILGRMRKLVLAEIGNSGRMIELCGADSRLGFHPEAEGYKYFPEKLAWRIQRLKSLLEDDFPQIHERLSSGENTFPEKEVKSYRCNSGTSARVAGFSWQADYAEGKLKISIEHDGSADDEFRIFLEERPFYPPQEFVLKGTYEIEIPLSTDTKAVGFNILKINKSNSGNETVGWEEFTPLKYRLVLADYNPRTMGRLVLPA